MRFGVSLARHDVKGHPTSICVVEGGWRSLAGLFPPADEVVVVAGSWMRLDVNGRRGEDRLCLNMEAHLLPGTVFLVHG